MKAKKNIKKKVAKKSNSMFYWIIVLIAFVAILLLVFSSKKQIDPLLTNNIPDFITHAPSPTNKPILVNPKSNQASINTMKTTWKTIIVKGCGETLPDETYSVDVPSKWTVKTDLDKFKFTTNTTLEDSEQSFYIGCTTMGVGGGCSITPTKFYINNKEENGCYFDINPDTGYPSLNAIWYRKAENLTFGYFAKGINFEMLQRIFSSMKFY